LKGTGTVDSTIPIYDGATLIGTASVVSGGTWSFQVTQPLNDGPHALSALAPDAAGNTSSAGNFTLTRDTTPPAAPGIIA
ncbi:Ig-like domain-containing protein, partial [Citrobacter freundii]|uniref:Ig-like domain-containing protein n=1 Tax=Citrobacter freundii TaxID=546 RepID=UPI002B253BD3